MDKNRIDTNYNEKGKTLLELHNIKSDIMFFDNVLFKHESMLTDREKYIVCTSTDKIDKLEEEFLKKFSFDIENENLDDYEKKIEETYDNLMKNNYLINYSYERGVLENIFNDLFDKLLEKRVCESDYAFMDEEKVLALFKEENIKEDIVNIAKIKNFINELEIENKIIKQKKFTKDMVDVNKLMIKEKKFEVSVLMQQYEDKIKKIVDKVKCVYCSIKTEGIVKDLRNMIYMFDDSFGEYDLRKIEMEEGEKDE